MYDAITNALSAYLKDALGPNPIDVAWPGVTYTPNTSKPYLRVTMAAYSRTPGAAGPVVPHMENGIYTVAVVWPEGGGMGAPAGKAQAIVDLFPRALSLAVPGQGPLIVIATSAAPPIEDGGWITIPVRVAWASEEPPA